MKYFFYVVLSLLSVVQLRAQDAVSTVIAARNSGPSRIYNVNNGVNESLLSSCRELIELRSEKSRTFIDPDGHYHTQQTAGYFHFKNSLGEWIDIQDEVSMNSVHPELAGIFRTELPMQVDVKSGLTELTLDKKGNAISYGNAVTMETWDKDGQILSQVSRNSVIIKSQIGNNEILLSDIFPGIDRQQNLNYWSLQTNYILNQKQQFPSDAKHLVMRDEMTLPLNWDVQYGQGEMTAEGWNGNLIIINEAGEQVSTISQPQFYDSYEGGTTKSSEVLHAINGTYLLKKTMNGFVLSILIPADWLNSDSLVYPLIIDPTITNTYANIQGVEDKYNQFSNLSCSATMNLTLPGGPLYVVSNTNTQYSILSHGYVSATTYSAGEEQRSRVGCNGNWSATQFGFGLSQSQVQVPYNMTTLTIANGCYVGGTSLSFVWQAYQIFFPYSNTYPENITGCSNYYHNLVANTWVVTVTYDVAAITATATPPSVALCSGETTAINLTSTPPGATFAWTTSQSGTSGASNASGSTIAQTLTATGNASGNTTYTVIPTLNGCPGTPLTVNVSVNPNYSLTINQNICSGQTYTFDGTDYDSSGTYTATFQTAAGCDSLVTLNLVVGNSVDVTIDETICFGESYTLGSNTYTSSGTYQEIIPLGACDSIVTLNLIVSPEITGDVFASICQGSSYTLGGNDYTTNGNFPVVFTAASGCDSIVTLHLTVSPAFSYSVTEHICEGESYDFDGSSYTESGTYNATYQTSNGCDSLVTLNLTVHPLPSVDIGDSFTACQGNDIVLTNSGTTGTYLWSTGETGNSISVSQAGIYTLEVFTGNNCSASDDAVVIFNPSPQMDFAHQLNLCDGEEAVLDAANPGSTYLWSTGQETQSITVSEAGFYEVFVTSPNGCYNSDFVKVTQFCESSIFVPSGFTPNSDGINDVWRAYGENITTFEMSVYNRWGDRVFYSEDFEKVWDGSSQNSLYYVEDGLYNWTIAYRVTGITGNLSETRKLSGHVSVFR